MDFTVFYLMIVNTETKVIQHRGSFGESRAEPSSFPSPAVYWNQNTTIMSSLVFFVCLFACLYFFLALKAPFWKHGESEVHRWENFQTLKVEEKMQDEPSWFCTKSSNHYISTEREAKRTIMGTTVSSLGTETEKQTLLRVPAGLRHLLIGKVSITFRNLWVLVHGLTDFITLFPIFFLLWCKNA